MFPRASRFPDNTTASIGSSSAPRPTRSSSRIPSRSRRTDSSRPPPGNKDLSTTQRSLSRKSPDRPPARSFSCSRPRVTPKPTPPKSNPVVRSRLYQTGDPVQPTPPVSRMSLNMRKTTPTRRPDRFQRTSVVPTAAASYPNFSPKIPRHPRVNPLSYSVDRKTAGISTNSLKATSSFPPLCPSNYTSDRKVIPSAPPERNGGEVSNVLDGISFFDSLKKRHGLTRQHFSHNLLELGSESDEKEETVDLYQSQLLQLEPKELQDIATAKSARQDSSSPELPSDASVNRRKFIPAHAASKFVDKEEKAGKVQYSPRRGLVDLNLSSMSFCTAKEEEEEFLFKRPLVTPDTFLDALEEATPSLPPYSKFGSRRPVEEMAPVTLLGDPRRGRDQGEKRFPSTSLREVTPRKCVESYTNIDSFRNTERTDRSTHRSFGRTFPRPPSPLLDESDAACFSGRLTNPSASVPTRVHRTRRTQGMSANYESPLTSNRRMPTPTTTQRKSFLQTYGLSRPQKMRPLV